jgi:hypothetical protein
MPLSNKTVNNLADALSQEVIDYIHEDERYAEFLMEMIPDAIQDKLGGDIDEDLKMDLSFCILDRICFRQVK